MDKDLTIKIYETMVKLNIMDNIFYEAQRQVDFLPPFSLPLCPLLCPLCPCDFAAT